MDKPAPLSADELNVLLQRLPGWTIEGGQLTKQFTFADFLTALDFVNRLAPYFELKDHHPDVHISYKRVRFELSRHDIGRKVTALDGDVAEHIERVANGG